MLSNDESWFITSPGIVNITSKIKQSDIIKISRLEEISALIFHEDQLSFTWTEIDQFILSRKECISISEYGNDKVWQDLTFLTHLKNLKGLNLGGKMRFSDLTLIGQCENLEELCLGEPKKGISLIPIKNLNKLTSIHLTSGIEDLQTIFSFPNLRKLSIGGFSSEEIKIVSELKSIESLTVRSGTSDLDCLKELSSLRNIEIGDIRKLDNLDFITYLESLESISLYWLKDLTRFPNIKNLVELKSVVLETMNGLNDFSNLKEATELVKFHFVNASKISPKDLEVLVQCENLKDVNVGFGSSKKNNEFKRMLNLNLNI